MSRSLDRWDPNQRWYRQLWRKVIALSLMLTLLLAGLCFTGLPHLQTDYHHVGPRRSNGWVPANQKLWAWYFGPTGWKHVQQYEYSAAGCPMVIWIPLKDCLFESN